MKSIITFIFLTGLLSYQPVSAQKKLIEGKVVFEITYPGAELDQQTMAMLPDKSTFYFKNEKTRIEVQMVMGSNIVIADGKEQTTTMLMDMMGNKMSVSMTKDDIENEKKNKPAKSVEIMSEKKQIAGYTCTKAIVTPSDTSEMAPYEVWFSNDIGAKNSYRSNIEGIEGFLMEFTSRQNNMIVKMTCVSVTDEKVDDAVFKIPEGYKPMTVDELKKMGLGK